MKEPNRGGKKKKKKDEKQPKICGMNKPKLKLNKIKPGGFSQAR